MSRMSMRSSYLKPPLPKSPIRLRSRQSSLQTPSVSAKKFQNPDLESKLAPIDYNSIANEIHSLAKKMKDEFSEEQEQENKKPRVSAKITNLEDLACNSAAPVMMFERGRFYDQYSVKRNERLRRKKKGQEEEASAVLVRETTPYKLGVNHEPMMTTKRRGATTAKKTTKKTVSMVETTTTTTSRYSLRSSVRKPPSIPIPMDVNVSAMKTVTTRRSGRRI